MAERNSRVFISYSRKDKDFVKKLNNALDSAGVDAWVDWEGIPLSSDWMAEITAAIEGSDAFLFVITPDSLASEVCARELELGLKYNKKIIPILHLEPKKGTKMPAAISKTNWVYLRPRREKFGFTIPKLLEAINTDLEWVRQHTRLLQRAREWENKNRNNSFLLQGSDLEDGERWLTESTANPDREVLPLQAEYISTSRKVSIQRQRNLVVGVLIALVVSIALGIFALLQRNVARDNEILARNNAATAVANEHARATQQAIAQQNEKIAQAQRSVAEAQIYQNRSGELNLSTLLAVDGWQRAKESQAPAVQSQAENILRYNTSLMPIPLAHMSQNDRIWNIKRNFDSTRFVTSSSDGTACVWTIPTGAKQYCVQHDGIVYDALFSRDDKYLITGSDDGSVRIWDSSTGKEIKRIQYEKTVWDLDVSPDGKWLAVGRADHFASIYDLSNLEKRPINLSQPGEVFSVVFSPDSAWLAVGTNNGYTMFWRVMAGYSLIGPKHSDSVFTFAFSPDSDWVVSVGADSAARVARTATGGQKYVMAHGDWVEDVAFSPDGTWFATASDDNKVRIFDIATGKEKLSMDHSDFVQRLYISPDGQWIASTGFDKTVRIWDASSGSQMMEAPLKDIGSALRITPDGKMLITADRKGNINTWDISSLSARLGYLQFPQYVHEVHFDPSGKWMAANSDDYKVWKVDTSRILSAHNGVEGETLISSSDLTYNAAISPDSKWVAVAELFKNQALLHNTESQTTQALKSSDEVYSVAFSPDSKYLASGSKDKTVTVWDVSSGKALYQLKHDEPVLSIEFSPNGKWLMAGTSNRIYAWDVQQQAKIAILNQTGDINDITFSRDDRWLATASSSGSVYLWDAASGNFDQPKDKFVINGEALTVDFSPDNRWLALGGSNKFAYLWDLTTGEETARIPHVDRVSSVAFSNDGKLLAAVSRKVVEFWDVSAISAAASQDIIGASCKRLLENMSETTWKLIFGNEAYKPICPNLPAAQN